MSQLKAKQGLVLFIFALVAVTGVLATFQPAPTSAAVSNTLNFQARLETAGGSIVPDGNYNVEFKLYNTSTVTGTPDQGACTYNSGTADPGCLWVETRTAANQVRVVNGYLTVNLGSVNALPSTVNWNQQLWLTMRIGGTGAPSWDAEMSPRIQLTAVPYAFQAGALGNGTNQVVFDATGNLVFQQVSTVKELSAASGTGLTIQGGAATTGTNVGGTLLLQGGAGASTGASGSVVVKPAGNDSTTAFQVQNAAGTATLLNADTSALKVSVNGNLANLFTSSLGLVQTGSVAMTNSMSPMWVAVQGKYAYMVGNDIASKADLEIVDISNPSSPAVIKTLQTGMVFAPNQVAVQGKYAYVAAQGGANGALQIIDVSNPTSPSIVSTLTMSPGPYGLYVSGRYVYMVSATQSTFMVIDVSNPAAPSLISTTNLASNTSPRKVYIQGRYAYIATFGNSGSPSPQLLVFDVNNPANPSQVGSHNLIGGGDDVSVVGRYAYVTEYGSSIEIFDISNPGSIPTAIGTAGGAQNSFANLVAGRYIFTTGYNWSNVIGIADISNPTSPSLLQSVTSGMNNPAGLALEGRYLFIANHSNNNLLIFDISGLETTAATIHSLDTGNIVVDTNASIAGDASIQGGLSVGGALQVNDNLGVSGVATFASNVDSAAAFQIQNAAGSTILKVGTSNLTSWTTNVNSITAVEQEASAIANGYAYVLGGTTTGTAAGAVATVQYAKVNADGSIGTWATTSTLPQARSYGPQTAPVWNGYIYYAGGYNTSGTVQPTVYYAKLNADGTVGTWNTTASLATGGPGAMAEGDMVAANGYLYWIGGYNGTADVATSYFAKINADGTVGSWASTGLTLPSVLSDFQAVVSNGYIYTVGGLSTNDIFTAKLTSTGALSGTAGSWFTPTTVAGNSLASSKNDLSAAVVNGYVYAIAGATGGGGPGTTNTEAFPLPADGSATMGNRLAISGTLSGNRWKGSAASANGYIYYFGGDSGTGSTPSGTVYYGSTTRISIAGDLDLLGLTNGVLSGQSNGGGGNIYAGSIHSVGNLSVQGNTVLRNGLSVTGAVAVKDSANSSAAFQVQNASSANLFTVDTTNNTIVLGNDGTTSALTVRGGAASGSNVQGSNITFDASNGTGVSGSGDFIFRTAAGDNSNVTYDNSAKVHDPGAPGTSQTISNFTVGNHTNRLLLVVVTDQNHSLTATTGVTFGGSNLTFLDAQNCPTGGFNPSCHVELWYMLNPAISTGNIVATVAGGATDYVDVAAASYYNVNQTTPFGTETHNSNFNTSPTSNSVTSNTTQLVFDVLGSDSSGIGSSNTSGATVRQTNNGGVVENAIQDKPGLAGTTSMGWIDPSADWMELTVPINPIADSSSNILNDRLHITAAGNVGINTASPQHTLDVAGTQNITGALSLGTASSATGTLVFNNAGNANTVAIQSGATSASYTLTLPTAVGAATQCLQAVDNVGTLGWGGCGGSGSGGVSLQATTPGTPDTGNFNISGTGIAATLYASTFDAASGVALNIGNSNATSINVGKTGSNITTTVNGITLLKTTAANSTTAFQIQNAAGNDNLFLANTVNTNLVTNSSAESNANNWAITTGTGTAPSSTTSQALYGNASLQVNTSATTNAGVKFNTGGSFLNTTTTYSLSFWAKIASGSFTVQAGRSDNNTFAGETTCTLNTPTVTTTWTRFTCSFTTTGTVTSGGYIFIRQSDSTSRTWYIDGVQLEQASSPSAYHEGSLQFNGTVTGPTIFQNASDTTGAFQIQNAAGTSNLFVADTVNGRIGIGTASPDNPLNISTSVSNAGIHINGSSQQLWLMSNMTAGAFNNLTAAGDQGIVYGGASAGTANGFVIAPWLSGTAGIRLDGSGRVGVGVSSPSHTLDLQGGTLTVATNSTYALSVGNAVQGDFTIGSDGSYIYLQSWNSKPLQINNQGNNIYLVPNGGNIGIGTTSTVQKLFVNSSGNDQKVVVQNTASPWGVLQVANTTSNSETSIAFISGATATGSAPTSTNGNAYIWALGPGVGGIGGSNFGLYNMSGGSIITLQSGGNVGIGTTGPNHALTVSKNISGGKVVALGNFTTTDAINTGILELRGGWASGSAANSRYLQFFDSATNDTNGIGEGSVDARPGGVTYNNSTADFGEYFTLLNPISYGDLVVSGTASDGTYVVTQATNQNGGIVGVLSDTAGFVGNAKYAADGSLDRANRDVVGFLGQIGTHVSDINGPIHVGDPITVSTIPGYGQKATTAGQIVGRAMADFDPSAGSATIACPAGSPAGVSCGRVKVLVEISWYDPNTEMSSNLQGGNYASLNITGDLSTYHLTVTSDATFKANIIVEGHVITGGDTPVADPQVATGTDTLGHVEGACTINGNDSSGAVTLVAGLDNLASGAQCTITFAKPFDFAPRPVVSATSKESTNVGVYAQTSTTQMTIYFSQVPQAGQQYSFNYWNPQ